MLLRYLRTACEGRAGVMWLDDVQWGAEALEFAAFVLESQGRGASAAAACNDSAR